MFTFPQYREPHVMVRPPAEYVYDGFGRRAIKEVADTSSYTYDNNYYIYGLDGMLIEEAGATGAATADYIYLDGQPVAVLNGSTLYYLHTDHLGTPRLATDSTQATAWSYTSAPFGDSATVSGTITQNLRLPGQYYDVETGWNHNGFRYYVPVLGRYIEPDPLGRYGSGNNLYAYVDNDPINWDDPFGLCKDQNKCDAQMPSDPDSNILARLIFAEATISTGITNDNSWKEMLALAYEPINRADYVANNPRDKNAFLDGTKSYISGTIVPSQFGSLNSERFTNPIKAADEPVLGVKGMAHMCDLLKRAIYASNYALTHPNGDPNPDGTFGNRTKGHKGEGSNTRYYILPGISGSKNNFYGLTR